MFHDPHRNDVISGKTKAELTSTFSYILAPGDVDDYLKEEMRWTIGHGEDLMGIRDTHWVVKFDHGKAVDVDYYKG